MTDLHASPHCGCGVNEIGQTFVDPICTAVRLRADPPPLPNRALLDARVWVRDGRLIVTIACDCATVVDVDITEAGGEFAVTCDGCNTVRWMTKTEVPDGQP